jgi:hypothetical protein
LYSIESQQFFKEHFSSSNQHPATSNQQPAASNQSSLCLLSFVVGFHLIAIPKMECRLNFSSKKKDLLFFWSAILKCKD